MASIETEALQNLFRSASNLETILRQIQSMPRELHGGEEALTGSPAQGGGNLTSTGSSGNINPEALGNANAPKLKLNLPKRRPPSFDIDKVGRNALCPCGSGKKFKQCCGREA